jgi:hypothetical protein
MTHGGNETLRRTPGRNYVEERGQSRLDELRRLRQALVENHPLPYLAHKATNAARPPLFRGAVPAAKG